MFIVSRLFRPLYMLLKLSGISVVVSPDTFRTRPDLCLHEWMTWDTYAVCQHHRHQLRKTPYPALFLSGIYIFNCADFVIGFGLCISSNGARICANAENTYITIRTMCT